MSKIGSRVQTREIVYRSYLPEHEVLISFDNDGDAAAFYEWWESGAGPRELQVAIDAGDVERPR